MVVNKTERLNIWLTISLLEPGDNRHLRTGIYLKKKITEKLLRIQQVSHIHTKEQHGKLAHPYYTQEHYLFIFNNHV